MKRKRKRTSDPKRDPSDDATSSSALSAKCQENGTLDQISPPNVDSRKKKKKSRKKKSKKQKTEVVDADATVSTSEDCPKTTDKANKEGENSQSPNKNELAEFPFPVDEDDHCESPSEAYHHVAPFLHRLAIKLGKSSSTIRIYDPYYCAGSVKTNLATLGFDTIINEKQDCYKMWQEPSKMPDFDLLITNPPYSGDHMEKMMTFLTMHNAMKGKPWLVLAPQFLVKKDYYDKALSCLDVGCSNDRDYRKARPFYLIPHKRYVYAPPAGFREKKKSDTHKKSSPFISMWYIWGGSDTLATDLLNFTSQEHRKGNMESKRNKKDGHENPASCTINPLTHVDIAKSKSHIRDLRRSRNSRK